MGKTWYHGKFDDRFALKVTQQLIGAESLVQTKDTVIVRSLSPGGLRPNRRPKDKDQCFTYDGLRHCSRIENLSVVWEGGCDLPDKFQALLKLFLNIQRLCGQCNATTNDCTPEMRDMEQDLACFH